MQHFGISREGIEYVKDQEHPRKAKQQLYGTYTTL